MAGMGEDGVVHAGNFSGAGQGDEVGKATFRKLADFAGKAIELPVIFASDEEVVHQTIAATPTHDGWYVAVIPIGECRFAAALCLGALAQWVEVGPIHATPVVEFLSDAPDIDRAETPPLAPLADGMEQAAPGLWHSSDATGLLLISPPPRQDATPMLITVPLRPIITRGEDTSRADTSRTATPGDA